MGSVQKTGGKREGLFARMLNGGIQQMPIIKGTVDDDAFSAVLPVGFNQLLAVGWTYSGGTNNTQKGWAVGFKPDGAILFDSKHGTGKSDGFLGLVATQTLPLAFGYQDDKGWLAEIKPDGSLGEEAKQSFSAHTLRWTAGHIPDPLSKVVYLAGQLTDNSGLQRTAVAAVDLATLSTKWLKVVGTGGEQPMALVANTAGKSQLVVAGTQGSGVATAAWLVVLDGDGKVLGITTEAKVGPRAYLALHPGPQGDLVALGGAEQLGVNPTDLPSYGWFARWDGAVTQLKVGRALTAGKRQMFTAAVPFGPGYLLAGNVSGLGLHRQGWLVQVNYDGLMGCGQ